MTKYNSDYFYNEVWLKNFIEEGFQEWITPVVSGMIEVFFKNGFLLIRLED